MDTRTEDRIPNRTPFNTFFFLNVVTLERLVFYYYYLDVKKDNH